MFQNSPQESVHALNTGDFVQKNTLFWTLWEGEELLGCAAVRLTQLYHFELKSMRVVAKYRKKGLASSLITHIINYLECQGAESISLETGTAEYFKPAISLYKNLVLLSVNHLVITNLIHTATFLHEAFRNSLSIWVHQAL